MPAWPYASLVLVAVDHDLAPILLLSDLAEHTKAIAADGRVSLLFDGTAGLDQPLTGPRVVAARDAPPRTDDERLKRAFPRPPSGCRDVCRLQRISTSTAWRSSAPIWWAASARSAGSTMAELMPAPPPAGPGRGEAADRRPHERGPCRCPAALCRQAARACRPAAGQMTGIDAEGVDLRLGGQVARLAFDAPLGAAGRGAQESWSRWSRKAPSQPDSAARHAVRGLRNLIHMRSSTPTCRRRLANPAAGRHVSA